MSFSSNTNTSHTCDEIVSPSVADILRAAATYLRRHGWTQGTYYADLHIPGPKACVLGAIAIAVNGEAHPNGITDDCSHVVDAFVEYLDHHTGYLDIGRWNDNPHRTKEQVIAALNDAATQWEHHH